MKFENYSIRRLTNEDLLPYFQLVEENRKRLEDFFTGTVSKTQTLEDTAAFISEILQKAKAKTYFPYLIIDNDINKLIGFLDLKNIDWNIPKSALLWKIE